MTTIPTVRRRRLGAELRRLREAAGFTLDQSGEVLECTGSKVSRLENGRLPARLRDVRDLLDAYGEKDEGRRKALMDLAKSADRPGWWQTYSDVVSDPYADYISLEDDATSIRAYCPQIIHSLLQTEEYASAVVEAGRAWQTEDEIKKVVAVRMARQEVLSRENPPEVWAVLWEATLRQQVGSTAVMRAQLESLVETAKLTNVTVQVLPYSAGAHSAMDGGFSILAFPEPADLDVVVLNSLTSTLYLERKDELRRHTAVFDHLRSAALPHRASVQLISRMIKET